MSRLLAESALLAMLAAAVAACRTGGESAGLPITGAWGGTHVGLVLDADGGTLAYDCASGSIDEPLRPDATGSFRAIGTHVAGHGGPEIEGRVPPRLPAQYFGTVRRERMTLRVRIPSTGVEIGPLTLRRGAEPILFRCL